MWHSLSINHSHEEDIWNFHDVSHADWESFVIYLVKDNHKRRERWDGAETSTKFAVAVSAIWGSNVVEGEKGPGAIIGKIKENLGEPSCIFQDDARSKQVEYGNDGKNCLNSF